MNNTHEGGLVVLSPPVRKEPLWKRRLSCLALFSLFLVTGCGDGPTEPAADCGGLGILCDVSGTGDLGGGGNGGPAVLANHYWPVDVLVGPDRTIYVVDWNNHAVRKIDQNGIISRFIGSGNLGDEVNELADQVNLNHPSGLTIGPDGHFYLAAWHNWKVKKIDSNTLMVTTAVGTLQGLSGDGGDATAAKMDLPSSVVFDAAGNMFIADQGNQRVRKVDATNTITTFAGSGQGFADGIGAAAMFNLPKGPDAGAGGRIALNHNSTALYLADTNNNRIRRIDLATYEVTTIAGTGEAGYSGDGGSATSAKLNHPTDVFFTNQQEIYIADSQNHVIRKIDATGKITTVVGTGQAGISPSGTSAISAMLNQPTGLYWDQAESTLYIADTFNHQVKRVELQ